MKARSAPAAWLFLLLPACPADPVECRLNSDCVEPLVCQPDGRCQPQCKDDRDCADTEECLADSCVRRQAPARVCRQVSDCRRGETCQSGLCQVVAFVDDVPPIHADAGTRRDAAAPHDAGATGRPYGSVCQAASDCASDLCVGPGGADGRCSRACAVNTDCVYPDSCLEVGGQLVCAVAPMGSVVGSPCPNGSADCSTGLCISPVGATSFCSQQCSPLPSCPAGMTCALVPAGPRMSLAACVQGTGGGFGEACGRASDCALGLCVGTGGQGVCTSFCDEVQLPCPTGWVCTQVDVGGGQTVGVCAPEGAVSGGFGAACSSAASCSSGLCLYDARTQSAFCTKQCRSIAECAAVPGLVCVALQGGVNVCGPP